VELQVAIKLDRDLEFGDRESSDRRCRFGRAGRATAEAGAGRDIRLGTTSDAFVLLHVSNFSPKASPHTTYLERTASQEITLLAAAERAGTGVAREFEASIGAE
jgi:hypothetical protein